MAARGEIPFQKTCIRRELLIFNEKTVRSLGGIAFQLYIVIVVREMKAGGNPCVQVNSVW